MDWNNPINTTGYLQILDDLKTRDFDALSFGKNAITNIPQYAMRYNRSTNVFEEYDGGWNTKVLAVAGGGTGVTSLAALKAGFGFGTMADQNANSVAISGGTINGISTFSISGKIETSSNLVDSIKTAGGITCAGVAIINTSGKIPAITASYFSSLNGSALTNVNAATLETHAAAYFATADHNHNGIYSGVGHNHDGVYQPIGAGISINSSTSVSLTEGSGLDYPVVLGSGGTALLKRTGLADGSITVVTSVSFDGRDVTYNTATISIEHGLVSGI